MAEQEEQFLESLDRDDITWGEEGRGTGSEDDLDRLFSEELETDKVLDSFLGDILPGVSNEELTESYLKDILPSAGTAALLADSDDEEELEFEDLKL
jgi:hypothetical protein